MTWHADTLCFHTLGSTELRHKERASAEKYQETWRKATFQSCGLACLLCSMEDTTAPEPGLAHIQAVGPAALSPKARREVAEGFGI